LFFPQRLNSTVRGGAREGIKAGGAERAGPKRRRVRVGRGRGRLRGWRRRGGAEPSCSWARATEVEDEADEWSPPASERSCWTQLSKREKRGGDKWQQGHFT